MNTIMLQLKGHYMKGQYFQSCVADNAIDIGLRIDINKTMVLHIYTCNSCDFLFNKPEIEGWQIITFPTNLLKIILQMKSAH